MMGWFGNSEERQLLKAIEQIGFRVTAIYDPSEGEPPYAYSTGFPDMLGQPEVIAYGLPIETMSAMIGELSDQCRDGLRMADGVRVSGLIAGHDCILRAVTPENIVHEHFHFAMWYQQRQSGTAMTEAFQIVWPGAKSGLFPWDADCADAVRLLQPALYEPGLRT